MCMKLVSGSWSVMIMANPLRYRSSCRRPACLPACANDLPPKSISSVMDSLSQEHRCPTERTGRHLMVWYGKHLMRNFKDLVTKVSLQSTQDQPSGKGLFPLKTLERNKKQPIFARMPNWIRIRDHDHWVTSQGTNKLFVCSDLFQTRGGP